MNSLSNGSKINKLVSIQSEYDQLVSKYESFISLNLNWIEIKSKAHKKEKQMSKKINELHSNYIALYKQINFNA